LLVASHPDGPLGTIKTPPGLKERIFTADSLKNDGSHKSYGGLAGSDLLLNFTDESMALINDRFTFR
jgi:hypothetical protein